MRESPSAGGNLLDLGGAVSASFGTRGDLLSCVFCLEDDDQCVSERLLVPSAPPYCLVCRRCSSGVLRV